jgi:hypothetical protein
LEPRCEILGQDTTFKMLLNSVGGNLKPFKVEFLSTVFCGELRRTA